MDNLGYVLMVDDSENDLELARRALKQHRLANDIVIVTDGVEALDFLFRRGSYTDYPKGDPLVVLLDVNMPRLNGLEVLAKMKSDARLSLIPVVMLTSSKQGPDIEECYRHGANAYVVKPVDFDQFAEAIKTIGKFWAVLNELPPAGVPSIAAEV